MALHISPEAEQQVTALAEGTGREPDAVLADIIGAGIRRYNRKLAALREAIDAGDASGVADDYSLEGVAFFTRRCWPTVTLSRTTRTRLSGHGRS